MEKKKWTTGNKWKRKYSPELLEETINIIHKYNIPFKIAQDNYSIIFQRGSDKFRFYITTDKWDVSHYKHPTKSYYSKGIEDFICRFLLQDDKELTTPEEPECITIDESTISQSITIGVTDRGRKIKLNLN